MPLTPVAVEMVVPDGQPELETVLLEACTRAVAPEKCVRSGTDEHEGPVAAVAIVSWPDETHARIELLVRGRKQWSVRQLDFEPADPMEERWRTVGFAIGTLAGTLASPDSKKARAADGADSPPKLDANLEHPTRSATDNAATDDPSAGVAPEPAQTPRHPSAPSGPPSAATTGRPPTRTARPTAPQQPPLEAPATAPRQGVTEAQNRKAGPHDLAKPQAVPRAHRRAWVDLAALTGPGLDASPWRAGASVGGALTTRMAYAGLNAAFTASPENNSGLSAQWLTLTIRGGFILPSAAAPLQATLGAELSAERLGVAFADPNSGERASGSRWAGSAALRLGGIWWMREQFAAFLAIRGGWRFHTTGIHVRNELVAEQSGLDATVSAGVRIGF